MKRAHEGRTASTVESLVSLWMRTRTKGSENAGAVSPAKCFTSERTHEVGRTKWYFQLIADGTMRYDVLYPDNRK